MAVTDPQSGAQSPEPTEPKPRRRRFAMPVDGEVAPAAIENGSPSDDDEHAALAAPGPAVGEPVIDDVPQEPETSPGNGPAEPAATGAADMGAADSRGRVADQAPARHDQVQTPADPVASGTGGDRDMASAFRDVHERRLHGFTLLVTLGNRAVAADLTRAALQDAESRLDELGHPERAAVWLRRHVLRHAPKRTEGGGRGPFRRSRPAPHGPGGISEIGADEVLVEALARLDLQARAALILQDVERLREVDVADTLATDLRALERLLRDARTKYSQAYTAAAARHGVADSMELPDDVRRSADPGLPRHE